MLRCLSLSTHVALALVAVLLVCQLAACSHSEPDPGTMTSPPDLKEIIGQDTASKAKLEVVSDHCLLVPRSQRKGDPWCQLEERWSKCMDSTTCRNQR